MSSLAPDLQSIARKVEAAEEYAIDIECFASDVGSGHFDHFDPYKTKLVGLSIAVGQESWYIPFGKDPKTGRQFWSLKEFKDVFHHAITDPDKKAVGWNIKFDYKILWHNGIKIENTLVDAMIAAFLCDENFPLSLWETSGRELGEKKRKIQEVWEDPYSEEFFTYGRRDAELTLKLWRDVFAPRLAKEGMEKPFWAYMMPVVPIAAEMELNGIKINTDYIQTYTVQAEARLTEIESMLYQMAGKKFNMDSYIQLGKIMFGDGELLGLGLPTEGITQKGEPIGRAGKTYWRTNREVLKKLALLDCEASAFPKGILEHRKLTKRLGTYCYPYLNTHTKTGDCRVHPTFRTIGAETGRWSCSRPNMQNLPRSAADFSLRRAVIGEEGFDIISADFVQLELMLMAELSGDKALCGIFSLKRICPHNCADYVASIQKNPDEPRCEHIDAHTRLAKRLNISRSQAKAVNFGAIYGMGAMKLQAQLFDFTGEVVPIEECERMLNGYFKEHVGVKSYHRWVYNTCIPRGWISTLLGRKRRIFFVNQDDRRSVGEAFRELTNASVQGCLDPASMVLTSNGFKQMRSLIPSCDALFDGSGFTHNYQVFSTGEKPVFKVTTADSRSIIGSSRQPFATLDECGEMRWTRLSELKEGEYVLVCDQLAPDGESIQVEAVGSRRGVKTQQSSEVTKGEAYLIGYLIGNGSFHRLRDFGLCYGNAKEIGERLQHLLLQEYGIRGKARRSGGSKGESWVIGVSSIELGRRLQQLGVGPATKEKKCVPDWALRVPFDVRRGLLQGLFDSDGGCSCGNITYSSKYFHIIRSVWLLLSSLGIASTTRRLGNGHYRLNVRTKSLETFATLVGFRHQKRAGRLQQALFDPHREQTCAPPILLQKIAQAASGKKFTNAESALVSKFAKGHGSPSAGRRIARKIGAERLEGLLSQSWERVVKIEPAGTIETWDIQIEGSGSHAFVAEGILTHNTAADVMNMALRNVARKREELAKEDPRVGQVKFISTIHDEMLLEVPHEIAQDFKKVVVSEMENCVKLRRVPLQASCGVGSNWEEAHG